MAGFEIVALFGVIFVAELRDKTPLATLDSGFGGVSLNQKRQRADAKGSLVSVGPQRIRFQSIAVILEDDATVCPRLPIGRESHQS